MYFSGLMDCVILHLRTVLLLLLLHCLHCTVIRSYSAIFIATSVRNKLIHSLYATTVRSTQYRPNKVVVERSALCCIVKTLCRINWVKVWDVYYHWYYKTWWHQCWFEGQ